MGLLEVKINHEKWEAHFKYCRNGAQGTIDLDAQIKSIVSEIETARKVCQPDLGRLDRDFTVTVYLGGISDDLEVTRVTLEKKEHHLLISRTQYVQYKAICAINPDMANQYGCKLIESSNENKVNIKRDMLVALKKYTALDNKGDVEAANQLRSIIGSSRHVRTLLIDNYLDFDKSEEISLWEYCMTESFGISYAELAKGRANSKNYLVD
ncbi:hypothetical protein N9N03_02090 [Chlamydiia bacterium]|nr:hypothetical protein [Chlamydiia bacterium]